MSKIDFRTLPDNAMVRIRELLPVLPFSSVTCWRRVRTGSFPQPYRLPGRVTCWRWGDVCTWLDAQAQEGSK